MIVGITIVQDEKFLIEDTIRHLLAHGIDRILAVDHRSTDGTSEILARLARETGRVEVERQDDPLFHQAMWANELAAKAASLGATWILTFDADEIFIPLTKPTLREELEAVGQGVLVAHVWQHASLERRSSSYIPYCKRVFSWATGCKIDTGAHVIDNHPGPVTEWKIEIRERHFLSADHYVAKTRKHVASRPPELAPNHGYPVREVDDAQLRAEYAAWAAQASEVHDPIPLRGRRDLVEVDRLIDAPRFATIPGWCTPGKAKRIARIVMATAPKVSVEVGVHGGQSLIALGLGVQLSGSGRIDGIDSYSREDCLEGDQGSVWPVDTDHEAIHKIALDAIDSFGLRGIARIVRKSGDEAAKDYADGSIGLLHLDGNHSELVSCRDVSTWLPKMAPRATWICDDTNWPSVQPALGLLKAGGFVLSEQGAEGYWSVFTRG